MSLDPVSEFELDILDHTGDINLATQVGEVTRWALNSAAEALTEILGLPIETTREMTFDAWREP